MSQQNHAHPCNFRIERTLDRGWGELAILYHWDSTSGDLSDLEYCSLFELTDYEGNDGTYEAGIYRPPDPPCVGWNFRTPTDGRTAPVALGCFTAAQGWAWDRHKLPGQLQIQELQQPVLCIAASQEYRFHCKHCGMEAIVPGPHAGPHIIQRRIERIPSTRGQIVWRYSCTKHSKTATLDLSPQGYIADSAGIGFGPWELSAEQAVTSSIA